MARLIKKIVIEDGEVVELSVNGGIYLDETGLFNHNCNICSSLHLLPNGLIPRAWKLSQLSGAYYKKGDTTPSLSGNHPNERCIINTLLPGWGFDGAGKVTWRGESWDEYAFQQHAADLTSKKS